MKRNKPWITRNDSVTRLKLKLTLLRPPTKVAAALPDTSEALSKSNGEPDPPQKGIAFMRPISTPGYNIVRSDAKTPSHATKYNRPGNRPVYTIATVATERMMKRERLIAPTDIGD